MPIITPKKLAALKKYFDNGGSDEGEDIAAFLECEIADLPAWQEAYAAKYPDTLAAPEPAPEPELAVRFVHETGIIEDLEIIRRRENTIFVQRKVEKDIVTIKLRGRDVAIECNQLRKRAMTDVITEHNLTVSQLLQLADLAR